MSGQGDHFVQTDFWFASYFDRTCTLLIDLNLLIYFYFKLLCVNYAPGLNHRIIFNILDMTPQTIDLTELIFFGWSVWHNCCSFVLHVHLAITCSKLLGFGTNSGYVRLPQPLIFGAFFFSLKGCGFHQWIFHQKCFVKFQLHSCHKHFPF